MKKTKIALSLILIITLQILMPLLNNVEAKIDSSSNILLKSKGVTITKTSKIEDIVKAYKTEAKLVTPSPFGGKTYTFYKGQYQDILYVETDNENNIISAGAISDDFESKLISHGEKTTGTVYSMQGTFIDGWFEGATGAVVYNNDKLTRAKILDYYKEYTSNMNEYEKYYCQHAIIMINHYFVEDKEPVMLEFNEEVFDTLSRIKKNGKTVEDYANENKKSSYIQLMSRGGNSLTTYSMLPNPFELTDRAKDYSTSSDRRYAYLSFDIKEDDDGYFGHTASIDTYFVAKELIANTSKEIKLTDKEKQLHQNAKEQYKKSVETYNSDGSTSIYITEPQNENAPLVAGKIKQNKLEGTIGFVNAIRAGAALPLYEHSTELSDYAQHKSTLTTYISLKRYPNANPHFPSKPSEVSQDFYNKAQAGMGGENLYGGSNLITTITNALNDIYGDPVTCGHRYNIISPYFKYMGVGITDGQGTHKFSGGQGESFKGPVVAWPSEGVTPVEAFTGGRWTCMINTGYSLTDNTSVTVKRLNDDKIWNFNNNSEAGTFFETNYGIITFSNKDLTWEDGFVYEITINNLQNTSTNKIENYTYRSVFASVYGDIQTVNYPKSINLKQSKLTASKGERIYLDTELDKNATEIALKWTTSNQKVAKVNQYGEITLLAPGTATITVTTLNGKKATCNITVLDYLAGDVNEDGKVNLIDYTKILAHVKKTSILTGKALQIADVNKDNKVNLIDYTKVLAHVKKTALLW